jgi:hypothetical protein
MRVEVIEDTQGPGPVAEFPPRENYVDLRENPLAVDRIAPARQYLPLRTFLTAVNSAESSFRSASASIHADSPASVSAGEAYEFASQARLVFAEPSFNCKQDRFVDLTADLKGLLERDSGDAIRAVLLIAICNFPAQRRRGFCLTIRLVAQGGSAEQAEMRCGLGLARLQQALLFSARALRQRFGDQNVTPGGNVSPIK